MTTANKITVLRVILVPVFLILVYTGNMVPAFIVYVVACLSDFLDGYIARKYHQISDFGKFMDPLADKMLVISAMCYFIETGRIPGWVVAIVCVREFAVGGLRMLAAEKQIVIAAAFSGKFKTFSTMVGLAIMLIYSNPIVDIVVWIIILLTTVYSGIEYFIKNKGAFNS